MSSNSRYTVILRGEHRFSLSKAQIQHDSPENNFFVNSFLRDFREGESHVVHLDQDPALFAIIVQHMSGYRILPLSPTSLPYSMTNEVAIENLVRDARFFGLDDLLRLLTLPSLPPHITNWEDTTDPAIHFEDVISGQLPSGIVYTNRGLCSTSADGGLSNVLVYGKNMRLDLELYYFCDTADPFDPAGAINYFFYIGIPTAQLQTLKGQHDGWKFTLEDPSCADRVMANQSRHRDASIYIDGRKALFMNLPLWLSHLRFAPEVRVLKPRYQDIRVFDEAFPGTEPYFHFASQNETPGDVYHLWIDEAFFLIRDKSTFAQPGFRLELLHARTSTRAAILSASFPPLRPGRRLI